MKRLFCLVCIAYLTTATVATPQQNPTPADPKGRAEAFLRKVMAGTIDVAYDEFLRDSPILEQGPQFQMMKSQTQAQLPVMGKMLGYEFLEEQKVGESLSCPRRCTCEGQTRFGLQDPVGGSGRPSSS